MKSNFYKNPAYTLIELIIVVGVMAILFSLLFVAITGARRSAARLTDTSKIKEINLSIHSIAGLKSDTLPYFMPNSRNAGSTKTNVLDTVYPSVYFYLLPTVGATNDIPFENRFLNRWYQSVSDISFRYPMKNSPVVWNGQVSFVANAMIFEFGRKLTTVAPDGLSNTIAWTTQYANCRDGAFQFWIQNESTNFEPFYWDTFRGRRASFADRNNGDSFPEPDQDNPGFNKIVCQKKPGTKLFGTKPQFAPLVNESESECVSATPTSFYREGLLCAMGDGSVRLVSPSVSEQTFWAAVTPAGGEVLGADW